MFVISHPTGNANVRAAASALADRNLLHRFYTTLYWNHNNRLSKFVPKQIRSELGRRTYDGLPPGLVEAHFRKELLRQTFSKLGIHSLYVGEGARFSIDEVYRDLDRYVASRLGRMQGVDNVYAYEDGALSTFESASSLGIKKIYDLPIGYWRASRQCAQDEAIESPEWAPTLTALNDSDKKNERKDRELLLADKIVVASHFTKMSLKLFPEDISNKIVVVPYGAPTPVSNQKRVTRVGTPLRVLYVGALSQRKGLSYLVEAMKLVGKSANLTLIGRPTFPIPRPVKEMCERHRWIPSLPHHDLLEEMSRHDVLVFPSLFEGFGLVITEALSRGLPVITTSNTGGPDVLRNGVDGFIVPTRSSPAIADCLLRLSEDRALLQTMSEAALQRAADLSWHHYQHLLIESICT